MLNQFKQWIEESKIITIFRHENPDLDALGSQFGLREWFCENYPEKKVYACGNESRVEFILDEVSDEEIKESLAIVLDTPTKKRIDDQRCLTAKKIVKIDHHPQAEEFADLEFVDINKAATCEYVPFLLEKIKPNGMSSRSAVIFYQGLLTDTLSFKTNNTTADTFEIAALLAKTGFDIAGVSRKVFDKDLSVFKFVTYLREKLEIMNQKIGYVILTVEDIEKFDLLPNQARGFVAEFGNIKELEAWAIFTQTEKGIDRYKGSLRSKKINLNEIAVQFQGGGHVNACGVNDLSRSDIDDVLNKINEKCV